MNKIIAFAIVLVATLLIFLIANNNINLGSSSISSSAVKISAEECIAGKATLYFLSTCPVCKEQKQVLGNSFDKLNTVDCGSESETIKCYNAGITSVPVWIIDGKRIKGVQTIEQLKELTGC